MRHAERARPALVVAVLVVFAGALGGAIQANRTTSHRLRVVTRQLDTVTEKLDDVTRRLQDVQDATLGWAPLGPFPNQQVLAVGDGKITVRGTKCYREDVSVRGSAFWQSVDPPGVLIPVGQGVRLHKQGCATETFTNPIPAKALEHPDVRTWAITGTETPFRDRLPDGQPLAWRTEVFAWPAP